MVQSNSLIGDDERSIWKIRLLKSQADYDFEGRVKESIQIKNSKYMPIIYEFRKRSGEKDEGGKRKARKRKSKRRLIKAWLE